VSQSFACLVKTAFQSFDNLKTVLRRARRDKSIDTTLTFSNTVLYFAGTGNYGNYGKSRVHARVTPKGLRGTTLVPITTRGWSRHHRTYPGRPSRLCQGIQQQSKVCIQACALLYIAAFCCTPNCHGIMSQLITGNYVIKFERNSFRVQLSTRGTATCFASAQPKAQVSGCVDCPSQSQKVKQQPLWQILDNSRGKSVKDLLSKCKQQVPSDDMVSFLRA